MNPKLIMGARIILGLILLVFGLNKFLNFMPPLEAADAANNFFGALINTGYMMAFIAITEIVAGVLLLANKYVPLALVIVFPVMLNALLFHLFLDPANIVPALLSVGLNIFLFFAHKRSYDGILSA